MLGPDGNETYWSRDGQLYTVKKGADDVCQVYYNDARIGIIFRDEWHSVTRFAGQGRYAGWDCEKRSHDGVARHVGNIISRRERQVEAA